MPCLTFLIGNVSRPSRNGCGRHKMPLHLPIDLTISRIVSTSLFSMAEIIFFHNGSQISRAREVGSFGGILILLCSNFLVEFFFSITCHSSCLCKVYMISPCKLCVLNILTLGLIEILIWLTVANYEYLFVILLHFFCYLISIKYNRLVLI